MYLHQSFGASPLARKIARDLGIDIRKVAGSGPGGRIVEHDVEVYAKQSGALLRASGPPVEELLKPARASREGNTKLLQPSDAEEPIDGAEPR